jgi:hypothetical protein
MFVGVYSEVYPKIKETFIEEVLHYSTLLRFVDRHCFALAVCVCPPSVDVHPPLYCKHTLHVSAKLGILRCTSYAFKGPAVPL